MTDELRDLGRRAIACRGWKWLDGMLSTQFGSRYNARLGGLLSCEETDLGDVTAIDADLEPVEPDCLPDFSDPATLGCLLALVREAHQCLEAHVYYATVTRLWVVRWGSVGIGQRSVDARTEAEALVVALEAADALRY